MRRAVTLALASALAGCAAFAVSTGTAAARDSGIRNRSTEMSSPRRTRPRIVVTPTRRFYRRCVETYVIEHRATGETIVPNMHCRWAYR